LRRRLRSGLRSACAAAFSRTCFRTPSIYLAGSLSKAAAQPRQQKYTFDPPLSRLMPGLIGMPHVAQPL